MNVLDLFSGIGGFSLGLERAGMRTVAFCEIDPYCRAVLARHWPDVPVYGDIRDLTAARLVADAIGVRQLQSQGSESKERRRSSDEGSNVGVAKSNGCGTGRSWRSDPASSGQHESERSFQIDVIAGGFPCQDISVAGKGAGIEGERSGLWKEYARIIGELRPRYVIVENVAALLNRGLDVVLGDLAALGMSAEWHCIPACAVGAPHRRDRVWIVAYPARELLDGCREAGPGRRRQSSNRSADVADADHTRRSQQWRGIPIREELAAAECGRWWQFEPDVGRVAHGVPARVDRLRSLGNAVVPQIPEIIGRAIMKAAGH